MGNTTKIIVIDNTTNKAVIYKNKGLLSKYLGISRETVVNWLRHGNQVMLDQNGSSYTIYKADQFIIH